MEKMFNTHRESGLDIFAYGGRQHLWVFYFCCSEESVFGIFSRHLTQTSFCRCCSTHTPWQ